jgi:hypothetical protein
VIFYPTGDGAITGDGAVTGDGAEGGGAFVPSTRVNPNFLISSFAINSFALSDGWYSSQNTYLLLSSHSVDAGRHVRAGRICPKEQHGESALSNPTNMKLRTCHVKRPNLLFSNFLTVLSLKLRCCNGSQLSRQLMN